MQRKSVVATLLVSAVIGAGLAGFAPVAAADSDSDSGASPGNRGWEAGSSWDSDDGSASDSDSDSDSGSDSDD